ncbi:hypothetical protein [Paeniclostridium hominis]|mgnify:CR=1 FL=1|uniref:hypothetical protein n=1 Tax=Paeniclostridium hominis TaxID=2764329 RepID=UPI0022E46D2B|nr:hypothetical protein [Paeniclostridium hominis]
MLKIKKIKDKEEICVLAQAQNCTCGSNGKPQKYSPVNSECLNDCSKPGKPPYYQSSCV